MGSSPFGSGSGGRPHPTVLQRERTEGKGPSARFSAFSPQIQQPITNFDILAGTAAGTKSLQIGTMPS
jgi:hypothetical protein